MLYVVNTVRAERQKLPTTAHAVAHAEQYASGSYDYVREYALGCARLVLAS